MFVPSIDKLRHRILIELLKSSIDSKERFLTAEQTAITVKDLAFNLSTTPYKIMEACSLMQKDGIILFDDFGKGECLYAWDNSATYLHEKTYLRQGLKRCNEQIYDVVKWVLPVMAIGVSLWTAILNLRMSSNKSMQSQQIEQLRQEISKIRDRENKVFHTLIVPDSVAFQKR